jgi:hypothetical protein
MMWYKMLYIAMSYRTLYSWKSSQLASQYHSQQIEVKFPDGKWMRLFTIL